MTSENLARRIETLPLWTILLVASVLYIPLAFLGYGSDSDAHAVVRAGQYFVATMDYVPSRLPGFFVHEVFTYLLNLLGSSLLTNLGTIGMSLFMLGCFYKLCVHWNIPRPALLTLIFMVHPIVWVNAGSTIDYLWALGFALFGFNRLLAKKYLSAVILFSLAIGCRLSTLFLIAVLVFFQFLKTPGERGKLILTGLLTLGLSFIFFIPPLDFLEWDFSRWLVLSTGDPALWTPLLRIGRFLYKNLMFWGLPAALWLAVIGIVSVVQRRTKLKNSFDATILLCITVIAVYEVLFLLAPIELEYLLPLLPFALVLIGKIVHQKPSYLLVLFALVLLANVLWINPARSTSPNQTSEVVYGLWIEKGYLLQDITTRLAMFTP